VRLREKNYRDLILSRHAIVVVFVVFIAMESVKRGGEGGRKIGEINSKEARGVGGGTE
jgi:hypothetical protein